MKRILFFILWTIPVLGAAQARGATIEIFVNGHKYDSLQEYQKAKNEQQQDYIRQAAKKMGIKVDFNSISNSTRHQLYVLGVENGVVGALQDFYQTWGQSDLQIPRKISSEQLQEAISQAVTRSKYPKLLISEPGKMRIMALTANDST